MAARSGTRGSNRRRTNQNNNSAGRKKVSTSTSAVRESPLAAAVVIGGVVAAGVFLWSRRSEISGQIGDLADQINDWRDGLTREIRCRDEGGAASSEGPMTRRDSPDRHRNQTEIAEEALTLKQIGEPA